MALGAFALPLLLVVLPFGLQTHHRLTFLYYLPQGLRFRQTLATRSGLGTLLLPLLFLFPRLFVTFF
jgi:hypothetical protein